MKSRTKKVKLLVFSFLAFGLTSATGFAQAQSVTPEQMQALAPNEQDLQGFTCVRPAGEEILDERFSQETHTWVQPVSEAAVVEDHIQITAQKPDNAPFWKEGKTCNRIIRSLYSENGLYALKITVTVYDTPSSAEEDLGNLVKDLSIRMETGSLTGPRQIGDESWSGPRNEPHGDNSQTLWFRQGKTLVFIQGTSTRRAARSLVFPATAVDAVAYQTLLRASQQPGLTGISVLQAHMDVNSNSLPKNALRVAGQTYVPVVEFAKAMGLTTQWNTKTGALTLSGAGRKIVTLTAGSMAASVGGAKAAALTVPVLKQAGQPVMTLDDLLTVTGGRITGRTGDSVQIKG